jgi:hypothetical protein
VPGQDATTKARSEFDQLTGVLNQLSPEDRKTLADLFCFHQAEYRPASWIRLSLFQEAAIIKPTVDTIRAKLDTLTKV